MIQSTICFYNVKFNTSHSSMKARKQKISNISFIHVSSSDTKRMEIGNKKIYLTTGFYIDRFVLTLEIINHICLSRNLQKMFGNI